MNRTGFPLRDKFMSNIGRTAVGLLAPFCGTPRLLDSAVLVHIPDVFAMPQELLRNFAVLFGRVILVPLFDETGLRLDTCPTLDFIDNVDWNEQDLDCSSSKV